VVFNLVESVEGIAEYEIYHAGLYDLLKLPYTGNTPQCLGNCLHKYRAKHILNANGILVPHAVTLSPGADIAATHRLHYPLITKLLKEDASIGISEHSVVHNETELQQQLKFLFESYRQSAIVEEFIEGREFNIGILDTTILPVSEISFEGLPVHFPKIVTYEGKWIQESLYYKHTTPLCPAPIDAEMTQKLHRVALSAYKAMDCRDYARVDVRVDVHGAPYVIEVNPNPDISTDAGFTRAASKIGIDYDALIKRIAEFAVGRAYQAA
jgi:D-alanine-D-alanine ligase